MLPDTSAHAVGKNHNSFVTTLTVVIAGLPGLIPLAVLPSFVGNLVDELGFGAETAGIVVSANLLGNALGILVVAQLLRHISLRKFVLVGAVIEILADVISWQLDSAVALSSIRIVSGVGGGIITAAAYNWLSRQADPDRGFGLLICLQFAVSAALLYLLPSFTGEHGVSAFYATFILFALLSVAVSAVLKQRPDDDLAARTASTSKHQRVLLDKPAIARALFAIALFEVAASGVWAFIERIGTVWELSPGMINTVLSIGALAGIPGALLVVVFTIRWGRARPITIGVTVTVIGLLLLLLDASYAWVYAVSMILFNGAWSYTIPYIQGAQAQLDPTGRIAVFGMFVVLLAISIGPFVFGFVIGDRGYHAAILLACGLLVTCVAVILGVARSQDRLSNRGAVSL